MIDCNTLFVMSDFQVKPLLVYGEYTRKKQTSWRPWGRIQSEYDADNEAKRIKIEQNELLAKSDFPLTFQEIGKVQTREDIKSMDIDADVILVYAAGIQKDNSIGPFEELLNFKTPILFFLRKDYLWYEILHPRFFRKSKSDTILQPVLIDDVVVENQNDLLSKLRALHGLAKTINAKIVTLGKPSGWGIDEEAFKKAMRTWNFVIHSIQYEDFKLRYESQKNDSKLIEDVRNKVNEYLSSEDVTLSTNRFFVENAFLLQQILRNLLEENEAKIFTIEECMSEIMPIAETTACLPLSMLNDTGYLAFCESDFVAIPAGILLYNISQKPVFLVDPTYPYDGEVIMAHCTSPRKMDAMNLEPVEILTHFESDYGAAPQVKMREGQILTILDPDFEGKEWLGFRGKIKRNPTLDICRTQIEIQIDGDWKKLLEEMKGFHWLVVYGDYLKEVDYALKRVGIQFVNLSE